VIKMSAPAAAAPTYTLKYFAVRGYGEMARLTFVYKGQAFEDYRYRMPNEAGAHPREGADFKADKAHGLLPFEHVPVLIIHGGTKDIAIPQSNAIVRYLAKIFGLNGSNDIEAALIDAVLQQVGDQIAEFWKVRSDEAQRLKYYAHTLTHELHLFERYATAHGTSADHSTMVGDKVSVADIAIYSFLTSALDQPDSPAHVTKILATLPHVKAIHDNIANNAAVKAYVAARPTTFI